MVTNFITFYVCEITTFYSINNLYCIKFILFYAMQKIYCSFSNTLPFFDFTAAEL